MCWGSSFRTILGKTGLPEEAKGGEEALKQTWVEERELVQDAGFCCHWWDVNSVQEDRGRVEERAMEQDGESALGIAQASYMVLALGLPCW